MARLTQLRKGLARLEAVGKKDRLRREPVKWHHMRTMQVAWKPEGRKGAMLWAAACMCFLGCMRAGEAIAPEGVEFDGKAHLSWEDVQLEDASSPKWIRVRIKESKMDRLRVRKLWPEIPMSGIPFSARAFLTSATKSRLVRPIPLF